MRSYYLKNTAIRLALLSVLVTVCLLVLIQNKTLYSSVLRSNLLVDYPEDNISDHIDLDDHDDDFAEDSIFSEQTALKDILKVVKNLPRYYANASKESKPKNFKTCAKVPDIYELRFSNDLWQMMETSNGTGYFYGAYYDDRVQKLSNVRSPPLVHILGMFNRLHPQITSFCQLFFDWKTRAVEVPVLKYRLIWNEGWGTFKKYFGLYPYLLTCQLPQGYLKLVPQSVSVVEKSCGLATNNLIVKHQVPPKDKQGKKDFAVCVKGLDFPGSDLSIRLIEWIETLRVLGAQKIFFYNLDSHRNIERALQYYHHSNENSLVDVVPMTLAGGQPNIKGVQHYYLQKKFLEKRLGELVAYNDCFLTNMHEYKYIVLLDVDEVIVPLETDNWKELLEAVSVKLAKTNRPQRAALSVQNVYFMDDIAHGHEWHNEVPQHMHMLQHTNRMRNFTKKNAYIKCFHNTSKVLTVHNHFPFACLQAGNKEDCMFYAIEKSDAQLNHYRSDCVRDLKKSCENMKKDQVMDFTLWRFKDVVIERVQSVMRTLGLDVKI